MEEILAVSWTTFIAATKLAKRLRSLFISLKDMPQSSEIILW